MIRGSSSARLRLRLSFTVFPGVFVALLAMAPPLAVSAETGTGITLTIDCVFCGREQPFPHDCPRVSSAAALGAAETFSTLLDAARNENHRLRSISGLDIPLLDPVKTIAELDTALAKLIAAIEDEIARAEREQAEYARRGAAAGTERRHVAELIAQLTAEVEQARSAITAAESATMAHIRAASAARDETVRAQSATNQIRQEIRNVRNRLFPRLHRAAQRGWVHPPSTYRTMPQPLAPKTQLGSLHVDEATPADTTTRRIAEISPASAVAAAPVSALGARALPGVQAKLSRLAELYERARATAAERDEAIRTLDRHLSDADEQAARLSALQPQRAAAASQLALAQRNVGIARQTQADYEARLASARSTAVHAWIEWGIFQLLDRKAAALQDKAETQAGQPSFLDAWRETVVIAVRLGSEPHTIIQEFPASATPAEMDELRRDLAGAREKFGVAFAAHATLPAPIQPYVGKGSP